MVSPVTESVRPEQGGLSAAQAAERLARDGFNELEAPRRRTAWRIALEVASEPMLQLLAVAGLIYVALGDRAEALMLLTFVAITAAITVLQERRAERVIEALRDLASPRALVVRDGQRLRIAGREVVVGDRLVLVEGDRVPADAILLEASDFKADESLLTGESVPVSKLARADAAHIPAAHEQTSPRPGGDGLPWVFSGTLVVGGQGVAEVLATGPRSEVGRLGQAIAAIAPAASPLQQQVRRLVRLLAGVGLALSLLAWGLYGWTRGEWLQGLLAGITLAMAMLPEELPLILTVFMAMGSWRLSRQRVLTRRAAAIETLGAATVLCTDKTGTLTVNRMRIAELAAVTRTPSGPQGLSFETASADGPQGEAMLRLLEIGVLASEREPVDPMERAFVDLAAREAAPVLARMRAAELVHEYSLSRELLAMSHLWREPGVPGIQAAAKGAPEAICTLCRLDAAGVAAVRVAAESMATRGMRVLGVAQARLADGVPWPASQREIAFEFVGLVALADPLREGVPEAVRLCREAGIRVVMITGDFPATARAIAQQAGIAASDDVLSGDELTGMTADELAVRAESTHVFARIMPEQKLRIVEALRASGQVVAMTGDGVNDAPSLRAAHIGIAMGGRGTDVAREAADIVLLDDDFGSIVQAVRLGRRIDDNLRKAMGFVFSVHVPIAGLSLLPLLFGLPLLFSPMHVAFLELIIDPVSSVVFEAEPEEHDLMSRPPRDPAAPLLDGALFAWSLAAGALALLAVGAFYAWQLARSVPPDEARAAAFMSLVLANFGLVLANRSLRGSLLASLRRRNPLFWQIVLATTGLLALVMAFEPARRVFRFALPDAGSLGLAVAVAGATWGGLMVLQRLRIRAGST